MTGMQRERFDAPRTDRAAPSVREVEAHETALTYRAMVALRQGRAPLATVETFITWVNKRQRPEGYRLLASFAAGSDDAVAVAGFRRLHSLLWGNCLYIDDLVTLPEGRGQGHADALLSWLIAEAQRLGCEQLHLDSGMQRHAAHRFYLNHRLDITALHFQMTVEPGDER
ncbi:MAG: GNAT family N-acetyltransferase [Chloroflexota bacterium]|nr:GNAT family N-acetyltransferase [Chloroflexota bacterium]